MKNKAIRRKNRKNGKNNFIEQPVIDGKYGNQQQWHDEISPTAIPAIAVNEISDPSYGNAYIKQKIPADRNGVNFFPGYTGGCYPN